MDYEEYVQSAKQAAEHSDAGDNEGALSQRWDNDEIR
jgi:hypothetical protein